MDERRPLKRRFYRRSFCYLRHKCASYLLSALIFTKKNTDFMTICWSQTECDAVFRFEISHISGAVLDRDVERRASAAACALALEVTTSNSFGHYRPFRAKLSNYFRVFEMCVYMATRAPQREQHIQARARSCTVHCARRLALTLLRPRIDRCTVWLCATRSANDYLLTKPEFG